MTDDDAKKMLFELAMRNEDECHLVTKQISEVLTTHSRAVAIMALGFCLNSLIQSAEGDAQRRVLIDYVTTLVALKPKGAA